MEVLVSSNSEVPKPIRGRATSNHLRVKRLLDEVDGEEAFANAAFAVENEVETFHVFSGLSIRTCAMRGPQLRICGIPLPLGSAGGSCPRRISPGSV